MLIVQALVLARSKMTPSRFEVASVLVSLQGFVFVSVSEKENRDSMRFQLEPGLKECLQHDLPHDCDQSFAVLVVIGLG